MDVDIHCFEPLPDPTPVGNEVKIRVLPETYSVNMVFCLFSFCFEVMLSPCVVASPRSRRFVTEFIRIGLYSRRAVLKTRRWFIFDAP
jgi:hypothetical protein